MRQKGGCVCGLNLMQKFVYTMLRSSPHPYRDNMDEIVEYSCPGAKELVIRFDPRSCTERNYDFVKFFHDASKQAQWGQEKYSGTEWPGVNGAEPLVIPASSFVMTFHSDGSNNGNPYTRIRAIQNITFKTNITAVSSPLYQ